MSPTKKTGKNKRRLGKINTTENTFYREQKRKAKEQGRLAEYKLKCIAQTCRYCHWFGRGPAALEDHEEECALRHEEIPSWLRYSNHITRPRERSDVLNDPTEYKGKEGSSDSESDNEDCAAEYKEKVRDTDDEMSMSEEDNEFKADEYKNWTCCGQSLDGVKTKPRGIASLTEEEAILKLSIHDPDGEDNEKPSFVISNFTVVDEERHVVHFDGGLIENGKELFIDGSVKGMGDERVEVENFGPLLSWWLMDLDDSPTYAVETDQGNYYLEKPSDLFLPWMLNSHRRLYLWHHTILYVNAVLNKYVRDEYDDYVEHISALKDEDIEEGINVDLNLNEEFIKKNGKFLNAHLSSYYAEHSHHALKTSVIKELRQLTIWKGGKAKKRQKVYESDSDIECLSDIKPTVSKKSSNSKTLALDSDGEPKAGPSSVLPLRQSKKKTGLPKQTKPKSVSKGRKSELNSANKSMSTTSMTSLTSEPDLIDLGSSDDETQVKIVPGKLHQRTDSSDSMKGRNFDDKLLDSSNDDIIVENHDSSDNDIVITHEKNPSQSFCLPLQFIYQLLLFLVFLSVFLLIYFVVDLKYFRY